MAKKNYYVRWLDSYAGQIRKKADGLPEGDAARTGMLKTADGIAAAADALELALAGVTDSQVMGGHVGLARRLAPGQFVGVRLVSGERLFGELKGLGRYDFAVRLASGAELVVPKSAVLYWELLSEESMPVE